MVENKEDEVETNLLSTEDRYRGKGGDYKGVSGKKGIS
jgi:hypothetical protein